MDKNTIIGFLLIGVVLIVFTWLNQPTPEQIEAQRRMQDSIARIEYAKQLEQQKELNREAIADDELAGLPDSVRLARLQKHISRWGLRCTNLRDTICLLNIPASSMNISLFVKVSVCSMSPTWESFG